MKRKTLTLALCGLLALGSMVPIVANASETWDYGLKPGRTHWYNYYLHSDYKHYGSITKNGYTYYGPVAQPGYWSMLDLEVNGPYLATYNKHISLR